jgi:hypothetical protein
MTSAAAVLVCVLTVLGRSPSSMPPIELVDTPPPDVSPQAQAFVRRGTPTIYLLTSTPVFKEAARARDACGAYQELRILAAILVHEEWHLRNGSDERGAYEAQLTALNRLGLGPGSAPYYSVTKSMVAVLKRQRRAPPEGTVALR